MTRKRPAFARITALARAAITATFFSSLPGGVAAAANEGTDPMTSRTKAHVLGLVLPDFPADVAPGASLEVAVRIGVNPEGRVSSVHVTSSPSAADAQVIGAVSKWYVVPVLCGNSGWTASEVRTAVVFGWEGDRKFVTVRDPRWHAAGEQVDVPKLRDTSQSLHRLEFQDYIEPEFPRTLMKRRVAHGIVVTRFRVDEQGRVTEVLDAFAWPSPLFDSAVRTAMAQWRIRRVDREPITAPFSACIEVSFRLA